MFTKRRPSALVGAALLAALCWTAARAAPADLDPAFDVDGKVFVPVGASNDHGRAVAVQADGKILLGGQSWNGSDNDFALARCNADGTLDPTFSGDGKLTTPIGAGDDIGLSVAVQSNGKILLGGYSFNGANQDFALARYNADGSPDTGFDGDGKLTTAIGGADDFGFSVAVQSDGKIVVGGYSSNGPDADFALTRYNTNGSLDTGFDGDGMLTTSIDNSTDAGQSVAIQADGKILLGGYSYNGLDTDFALARYNVNGSLDGGFDGDGKLTTPIGGSTDVGHSVAVYAGGKILLGGYSYNGVDNDFALARYDANGSLDAGFHGDGILTTAVGAFDDVGRSVAVQANGKILLGGECGNGSNIDFALARFNSDGALDTSFGGDGTLTTTVGSYNDEGQSVAVQADGKILLAGFSHSGSNIDFAVVRYLGDLADTIPPVLSNQGVGASGASNGMPYLQVLVTDAGSGVLKVQLTANSSNVHLEYPLGTRVVAPGTPRPHTLILPSGVSSITVYAVKDTNSRARVEVRAWDAADNTALADPVIANLEIKQGRRLARTFTKIPAEEHYVTLQNGSPGITEATLWVNGKVVSRGGVTDGQVVTLNVAAQMRSGKRNTVRIAAAGPKGAKAVLLIGDQSLAGGGVAPVGGGRALNLEFAR